MNEEASQCIVLCDYPIKTMGYLKMLTTLNVRDVRVMKALPDESDPGRRRAKLLVVDMNWLVEEEDKVWECVLKTFPCANVLFMREETVDLRVAFEGNRDICMLGKLADVNLAKKLLKLLAEQARNTEQAGQRVPLNLNQVERPCTTA